MITLLFVSTSMNAKITSEIVNLSDSQILKNLDIPDCHDRIAILVTQADNAGWSIEELTWLSNGALAVYCYGYTWDDVYAAG